MNAILPRWVRRRRGAAAMLFGLMLPVLIGLTGLSVDTAMLAAARSQLSTVADSAALAGAIKLATENRVRGATTLTAEIASANDAAQTFGLKNTVLAQAAVINQNT